MVDNMLATAPSITWINIDQNPHRPMASYDPNDFKIEPRQTFKPLILQICQVVTENNTTIK